MNRNKARLVVFVLLTALTLLPQAALAADSPPICADEVVPGVCLLRTLAPAQAQAAGSLIVGSVNFAGGPGTITPESVLTQRIPQAAPQLAGSLTRLIPQ